MDWRKIFYGKRYDSSSRNAFIISGITKGLLVWFYIQSTAEILMLPIIEDKRQKKMSTKRTPREALKVWRLIQF